MKKVIIMLSVALVALNGCQSGGKSPFHDGIRWEGENKTANYLAQAGLTHFINIEFDKAYTLSEEAILLDSSLFASHTLLAMMGQGEKKDYHTAMAKKYSAKENETGKLFVSLLDIKNDTTGEQRRNTWAKMHELSNGPFIHYMYARTRTLKGDTAAVITEYNNLITLSEANNLTVVAAAAYNIKGYLLQITGDLNGAVAAIERSAELYPNGHNPIDSRAEMYLFARDTANAIAWYKKVLEKYPFSQSAQDKLESLKPKGLKPKK